MLDQSLRLWLASCSFNGIAWCWKLWGWRLKWTDVTWCCRMWFVLPKGKRIENTPKNMPISHLGTEAAGNSVVRYWGQAPRGGNSTWVTVTFLSRFLYQHFLVLIQIQFTTRSYPRLVISKMVEPGESALAWSNATLAWANWGRMEGDRSWAYIIYINI